MSLHAYFQSTIGSLTACLDAGLDAPTSAAIDVVVAALAAGHPLLICGNGGSATDANHIAGELVGRYRRERRGLKAIALTADPAVITAWSNDYGFDGVFARQVEALGAPGGVVMGLSTSGNSENVVRALDVARHNDMTTIALTGAGGGRLAPLADILIAVPADETARVQELHTVLYHYMCENIERRLAA